MVANAQELVKKELEAREQSELVELIEVIGS